MRISSEQQQNIFRSSWRWYEPYNGGCGQSLETIPNSPGKNNEKHFSRLIYRVKLIFVIASYLKVTYGATSTELSDQSKYSYLLRTVPPDSFQSLAMIDFIEEKLNWRSVYGLYSTGSYGEYGFAGFLKATENRTLCVVNQKKISPGASVADLQAIIKEFYKSEPNIKGIVCYCEIPDAKNIVQAIKEENLTSHYRLIASDTWYQVKSDNTIIFSLHYNHSYVKDFYDNWYSSLSPENFTSEENPWFKSFWEQACKENAHRTNSNFACNNFRNNSFGFCLNSTRNETCQRDDKIPYTMDAVYAFAQAIHNYIVKIHHGDVKEFKSKPEINRTEFLSILKNVSFNSTSGLVKFPVVARYDIRYRAKGEFELIGEWSDTSSNKLKMYKEDYRTLFGSSSCQMFCNKSAGEKLSYTTKQCCWKCEKCADNEYLPTTDKCEPCQKGYWPDSLREKCIELPPDQISFVWFIVIVLLGTIGFIVTFVTIVTFLKNNSTPLVRASGREMTYLLLVGILFLFFLPFFMLSFQTSFMCRASRFGLGLCLCICYSSLLIKTNRIARIFSGRQDVSFLTPRWQLVLVAILLLPQVCISTFGFTRNTERVVYKDLSCYEETPDFYATIVYNLLIIFLTTFYAFRTRKAPSNFNEARDIGFVMYTTIVIWLAFLPVFFGTSAKFKTIAVMLDTIIVATTLLVGLFAGKVYIIVLRPDKNVKMRSVTFFSQKSDLSNGTVELEDYK